MNVNRVDTLSIKGKTLQLIFFGDLHLGSKDCDVTAIKKQIEWIKNTKNVLVIMMGDTINSALRTSVGAGCFDDVMTPSEQIKTAIKLLTPIKHKIVALHSGNHSARIYNVTSIEPEEQIANALGVPFAGESCFSHIRFGNQTYVIFSTHGATGAVTATGALSACMKYSNFAEADIYAMGHVHRIIGTDEVYYKVSRKDKTLEKKKRYYVICGGYLKWKNSYAEAKGYSPQKIGSPIVNLHRDKWEVRLNLDHDVI